MQRALTRKLARRVMALALLISPPDSREWAAAMAAELDHVEGSFEALSWSIGCFGTAVKQLCVSILSPGALAAETEGSMSKFAKISAIVLLIGSALFLFAPTFQQGVKLTAASWHPSDSAWLARMQELGEAAESKHDAQALAFVAMQLNEDWGDRKTAAKVRTQRDKFADKAVQWNADLTWIYCAMLSRDEYPGWSGAHDPNDPRWTARLEAWDPNNAVPYALAASFYRPARAFGFTAKADRALLIGSPQWLADMEKAFSATNYDSYVMRKASLDSDIARRYGFNDPDQILLGVLLYRNHERFNFNLYAKDFLLPSGEDFEAKGNLARAEQDYWKIAHLGELMQLRGSDSYGDALYGIELQQMAGPKLQNIFEKSGNTAAASLVAYQAEIAQKAKADFLSKHRWADVQAEFRPSEAWTVQLSLLGMAIALALILCSAGYFAFQALLRRRIVSNPRFSRLGLAGAGLLLSSAIAMYSSFAPYAAALRSYLARPNPENAFADLARFQLLQSLPSEVIDWFLSAPSKVYFWYTVIALGVGIIVWILYRYISRTFRHSTPVQPAA